jgi:predicted nuclease with TOPRIM domain
MAFTVRDYHDLVRLLAEHPEWQLELRRLLMSEDLQALPGIVRDLAEAQRRAEERLSGVEERLSGVEERLSGVEERLSRLEEAVVALAEAQQRTERALQRLSRQVGGLSETVGGDIEDIAYIVLHDVLKREFDWQVGVLERSWQTWDGQPEEVNVFGQASDPVRPERVIWIVGEAKHNLTAREVDRFIGQVERARQHLEGEVFAVCFCYRARPEVQQMVRDAGLRMVFSYGKLV